MNGPVIRSGEGRAKTILLFVGGLVATLLAVVAVVVLARMSRDMTAGRWGKQVVLGLIAGGATGNLIDRIRSARGVVDFLDVGVGPSRWPTFNVADIAVSCGAVALAIILWREDDERARQASESAPA